MSFTLDPLTDLNLAISPDRQQHCWEQAQTAISPRGQWHWYLSQICRETLLPWLQADGVGAIAVPDAPLALLEWVPGTVFTLNGKRLVLVPQITLDTREFSVPQEWVDIPAWAGDYFLAVQVDPDELQLRVWGYTTHRHLKAQSHYDSRDRTYVLEAQQLVPDLSVLWVVQQLAPTEPTQTAIAELPALSATDAEQLLTQLGDRAIVQPRLEVPFAQWGAFLTNENLVRRLSELRQVATPPDAAPTPITQLGQWLQNQMEAGWQTLESLIGDNPEMALRLRQSTELSATSIKRVKLLTLLEPPILLIVALEPDASDRIEIRVQLRTVNRVDVLPETLSLNLLQRTGEVIQSVQARSQDSIIQLKRFKCPLGTEFCLQVAIGAIVHTEDFIV